MSAMSARVFSGYRRLFRARKSLFIGDILAMKESRVAIRAQFDSNRNATDPTHIEGCLTMVDEAEDMILNGIVRGELNEDKNSYEVKIKPQHAESMDGESITHMDPITSETSLNESSGKPDVVVTSSSSSGGCSQGKR
mmetsp:Transcript_9254/g.13847  ORF Transcript_9254/g.13847 Transcript_9254/m.13847 type:complete len:138 (-) Transcript_9254:342-755(-)|eukprot:CAMPEP_0194095032 /NCGR_PEP_ID=MMETSP0149-20130528/56557_1 /TAXON_ID=122233 /ORGANISM="Chaetoceros debilis, Strain MM31A-1" /LENGTH=137 /DNA_ID=CAMNT_0038780959 /DNA_START=77 /DNA_END=493 /DNA_ORIENTATION=-